MEQGFLQRTNVEHARHSITDSTDVLQNRSNRERSLPAKNLGEAFIGADQAEKSF